MMTTYINSQVEKVGSAHALLSKSYGAPVAAYISDMCRRLASQVTLDLEYEMLRGTGRVGISRDDTPYHMSRIDFAENTIYPMLLCEFASGSLFTKSLIDERSALYEGF